jgi:ketosteroid isomerase-like protein
MAVIATYTHTQAALENATKFVTLGDYQRLRDLARTVIEAYEDADEEVDVNAAVNALAAEASKPTV